MADTAAASSGQPVILSGAQAESKDLRTEYLLRTIESA